MNRFYDLAKKIEQEVIGYRRALHMCPEIGNDVYQTLDFIKKTLEDCGVEYKDVGENGLKAIIKGKEEGKVIGVRTDMDALPIEEKNNISFKSKNIGAMHACGHDVHMAIVLGVVKVINQIKNEINGTIVFLFEPAEETSGGAQAMIKDKALEEPHIDNIIGLHVSEKYNVGDIAVKKGFIHASSNPFEIKINGVGGHGAHPEDTIDPIFISANVITALQGVISREINSKNSAVITVGKIKGGSAGNVIPSEVILEGAIRTTNFDDRDYICKRVTQIAKGVSESLRGSADVKITQGYPCLLNDDSLVGNLIDICSEAKFVDRVILMDYINMGVESFAYFAEKRPSLFYFLGTANGEEYNMPAHNSCFDVDESAIIIGIALQTEIIYKLINKL